MGNMTLKIGEQTNDLEFDENGIMKTVYGSDTTAQNVRMALTAWKNDFLLVPEHGTDYKKFFSEESGKEERAEVIREAVFQEEEVAQVEKIVINDREERKVNVLFQGRLSDGKVISMEVDT